VSTAGRDPRAIEMMKRSIEVCENIRALKGDRYVVSANALANVLAVTAGMMRGQPKGMAEMLSSAVSGLVEATAELLGVSANELCRDAQTLADTRIEVK
jgi:hypothetical protein